MIKKNALYITPGIALAKKGALGVKNKIHGQISALNRLGYSTTLVYHDNGLIIFENADGEKVTYGLPRILWAIGMIKPAIKRFINDSNIRYDLIYIRKPPSETIFSLSAIKFLGKHSDKIISEIATYPYDREIEGAIKKLKLPKDIGKLLWYVLSWSISDKIFRTHLKKYIDFFAVITSLQDVNEVYGAPGIKFSNGIDIDKLPIRNRVPDNILSLVGIAGVSYWHGYDRIIYGLNEYYLNGGDKNIIFHIVGDGEYISELKELTDKLNLNNRVIFHGLRYGKELNEIINHADIGIASLGHFRKNRTNTSELKIREYCARNLPYIQASIDNDIPDDFPWKLRFENNDTPIDIEKVISFSEYCIKRQDSIHEMRDFAKNNLTWDAQFKILLDFAKKH